MTGRTPDVDRRTLLRGVGAGLVPLGAGGATAATVLEDGTEPEAEDPVSDGVDGAVKAAPSVFGEIGRRIGGVRYPLVGVPAIVEPDETLRVELDADPEDVSATLQPAFGAATPDTELRLESLSDGRRDSEVWVRTEAAYTVAEFAIPGTDQQFTEGLYDLRVEFDGEEDGQPRAVSVHDPFPEEPSVAIMGDPHVGDPRPFQDGAQKSWEERDPDPFLFRYGETFGTGTEADRWGAFQRANAELNAEAADVVIVIGDLAFGSANYYQEYEDAYRVLNQLDVPTFLTLGNHDGYITPGAGIDGKALWRRYFTPWYYSVDIRPDLHFVSIDSYDWPAMDRIAPSAIPSTWGGQVRDEQLAWLERDLVDWRKNNDGTILTLSHHNPSWEQTTGGELTRTTDGHPGAEQVGRGVEQSGGGWVGENRLAVRRLLAETGVSMHLSGHAHRDRLARYHDTDQGPDATVVATTGNGLEHVGPDGEVLDTDAARKRDILANGDSTLFVEATTAASGTTQYWGWRVAPLGRDGSRVDPRDFGYPATDAFLEERALQPALWSATNADLGLYSTPSYLLESEVLEASRDRFRMRFDNGLARGFAGAITVPLGSCRGVLVRNGEKRWQRHEDDWQDVRVAFEVAAGESVELVVECVSNEP